jgi:hypothetical protein
VDFGCAPGLKDKKWGNLGQDDPIFYLLTARAFMQVQIQSLSPIAV